jgi:hypothetical protein
MAENKTIQLDIQTNLGSLKTQLKEAKDQVTKFAEQFGVSSQQVADAADKVRLLEKEIKQTNKTLKSIGFEGKFNAITGSIEGTLSGVEAVQGALGLVGVESKGVEEALLKVNSAMALSQGVSGIFESINSFKKLTGYVSQFSIVQKISTAAQWLWNAAMAANPLGAIVAVIAAVIAAGYKLITMFMESSEAEERQAALVKKHANELKKQELQYKNSAEKLKDYNKYQYDLAKASGKSSEELRKLALKHAEEELALANKNKELAKATYLREKDILATLRANGASDEVIKKQEEVVKQARENSTKTREAAIEENKQLVQLKRQQIIEIKQEQTDAHKKELEDKAEQKDKLKKSQKEADEEALKAQQEYNDALLGYYDSLEKERQSKIVDAKEKEIQEIDNKYEQLYALADKANITDKDLIDKHQAEIIAINEKYAKIEADKMLKAKNEANKLKVEQENAFQLQIEDIDEANFQAKLKKSMSEDEYEKELIRQKYFTLEEAAKGNAEQLAIIEEAKQNEIDKIEKKSIDKSKENQKQKIDLALKYAQTFGNAMGSLNGLLNAQDEKRLKHVQKGSKEEEAIKRKMFERDKKLRIVQTIIDTASNVVQSVRNGGGIPTGIPFGIAAATMGALQIATIAKTSFSSGNEQPSNAPMPSATSTVPTFNISGGNQTSQLLQGLQAQPLKAYVVSSDITSAQLLDQKAIKTSVL